MSLANTDIQKQKITFSRANTPANTPDQILKRKEFKSGDSNPNANDLTASEIDKKIHYTLPNGKGVEIDSRHAVKDKTGTITGVTAEAANKLEMDITRLKNKDVKEDITFSRKKPKAVTFKRKIDKKNAANLTTSPNFKPIGFGKQ